MFFMVVEDTKPRAGAGQGLQTPKGGIGAGRVKHGSNVRIFLKGLTMYKI